MQWDIPYIVSRSLTLEVRNTGRLAARGSISRPLQDMDLDALPVLLAFSAGSTPREALARLSAEWELEEEGFATVVTALLDQAFLVPVDRNGAVSLAQEGFASVLSHHHMLRDTVRVLAYQSAIARHSRGCSVVELGCGTGILSIFAARAGARRVVAIEESEIAIVAQRMFRANGCDEIDLRRTNSRDVELDEPADLLIHEILGVDPFAENLLPAVLDARARLLRPGGRLLPSRVQVLCIALEVESRPHRDMEYVLAEAAEVQRLYGVDLGPVLDVLAETDPRQLTAPLLEDGDSVLFKPKVLSEECLLVDLDLQTDDLDLSGDLGEVRLRIKKPGTLGALAVYFRAYLDEDIQLTNAPFAPPTSWGRPLRPVSRRIQVAAGEEVGLRVQLMSRRGRQYLDVDLA